MSNAEDYPPFGSYAFDQFLIVYFKRACDQAWDAGVPDHVPRDLCLKKDQYKIWGQVISVLWIRTWYGNRTAGATLEDVDAIAAGQTQEEADTGYHRLWQKGFGDPELPTPDQEVDPAIAIFDGPPSDLAVPQPDIAQDIIQVSAVPSFLTSILMRCPDLIDGTSNPSWRAHDAQTAAAEAPLLAKRQRLLLMLADREACEQGWVYLVAVDHRGRVPPTRVRGQAAKIRYFANEWLAEGVALGELDPQEGDAVVYESSGQGWDDW